MSYKLLDPNGFEIIGNISFVFVCDLCGNSAPFYNGMSNYSINDNNTIKGSYCSEICVRKALGL